MIPMLSFAKKAKPLFPALRAMVVGSEPTSAVQRRQARRRLTANLCEQMGSNEAGLLSYATAADHDAHPGAVGRVIDGIEAQIVDENDQVLPAGEIGQVRYRGRGYPDRYLNNAAASAAAFGDGWFYPGDMAALTADRYLYLKGRADDVINNGGTKFFPLEVEAVLLVHPAVAETAVIAWPHKRFGQIAAACIVTKTQVTTAALWEFCRPQLAGYKIPQIIAQVDKLPKNAMGKVV